MSISRRRARSSPPVPVRVGEDLGDSEVYADFLPFRIGLPNPRLYGVVDFDALLLEIENHSYLSGDRRLAAQGHDWA